MYSLYTITLLLTAIGGVNWGLIGLFDFNLVSALFGADTALTNLVYILVGLSALYLIAAHFLRLGVAPNTDTHHRTQHAHAAQH